MVVTLSGRMTCVRPVQPFQQLQDTAEIPAGSFTCVRPTQRKNATLSMAVRCSGRFTLRRLVQPAKVLASIFVRSSGRDTSVREVHPENAIAPREVTLWGSATRRRFLQFSKALSSIPVSPSGSSTAVNWQPANAFFPMTVTEAGTETLVTPSSSMYFFRTPFSMVKLIDIPPMKCDFSIKNKKMQGMRPMLRTDRLPEKQF